MSLLPIVACKNYTVSIVQCAHSVHSDSIVCWSVFFIVCWLRIMLCRNRWRKEQSPSFPLVRLFPQARQELGKLFFFSFLQGFLIQKSIVHFTYYSEYVLHLWLLLPTSIYESCHWQLCIIHFYMYLSTPVRNRKHFLSATQCHHNRYCIHHCIRLDYSFSQGFILVFFAIPGIAKALSFICFLYIFL